ncbi:MAG: hypothetical protein QF767_12250, partial [Alphaproteobacteria bacterium]|nr:hypothetical protein [Alphaproteobacteria bacterium]
VKPAKQYRAPSEAEREALEDLASTLGALAPDSDAEAIQYEIYEAGKRHGFENLRDWFKALYETLFGQSQGPRMGSFVALYGLNETVDLIGRALAGELAGGTDSAGGADFVDATRLATGLTGDAITANLFLLGFAHQRGLIPLGGAAIEQAIALNGVSVDANQRAFRWGRAAAVDIAAVTAQAGIAPADESTAREDNIDALVARRANDLTAYQNAAYARRYREFIAHVRTVEGQRAPGLDALSDGVARAYHKLLAYKDEYEIARLYSDGRFRQQIAETFEGKYSLHFSLAPPLFAGRDGESGHLKKRLYGPWMMSAYRVLAKFKFLRGTALDIFGHSAERRAERGRIADYEATVRELLGNLTRDNHALAVEVARLPLKMRGFGHIKQANAEAATARQADLMEYWRNPPSRANAAE